MIQSSMARLGLAAVLAFSGVTSQSQALAPAGRGQLLYDNHCIACHSREMHWRERRLATDWRSLQVQVRRWQDVAGLGWSEQDIVDVARHLNDTIYRYPQTSQRLSLQQ